MKQVITTFLILTCVVVLVGCKDKSDSAKDIQKTESNISEPNMNEPDESPSSESPTANDTDTFEILGTQHILYLATENGLIAVGESGQHDVTVGGVRGSYSLQVSEGKLYASSGRGTRIRSYSLEGELLHEFAVPDQAKGYLTFTCLPGDRFALLDNQKTEVHFVDHTGILITTVQMGTPGRDLCAVVVDKSLYVGVSDRGKGRVIEIHLDTYETSVFKDLAGLFAVSCIAYSPPTGLFYASDQDRGLYSFSKTEQITRVTSHKAGYRSISDVEIDYPRAYIMSNEGKIMIMDLQTGLSQMLCTLRMRTRSMGLHIASDDSE